MNSMVFRIMMKRKDHPGSLVSSGVVFLGQARPIGTSSCSSDQCASVAFSHLIARRVVGMKEDGRAGARPYRSVLPLLIGQELAAHGDFHPVSLGIFYFLDFHGEIDGAHDPIPEFLMNQLLEGISID